MKTKTQKTSDALEILYRRYLKDDPEMQSIIEEVELELAIARKVYCLRKAAGLTQAELAKLVGTQPSAISRLEDSDYQGHSLSMLRKIASVLDMRLELDFIPKKTKKVA